MTITWTKESSNLKQKSDRFVCRRSLFAEVVHAHSHSFCCDKVVDDTDIQTIFNCVRVDRYEILETLTNDGIKSELVLHNVDRNDGGLYLCLATNTYGKDEKSNKLLVIGECDLQF